MNKTLILLTNAFPYGKGEPYLETEVNYYGAFDKIYICSLQISKEQLKTVRSLPSDKFMVIPVCFASKLIYLLYGIIALGDKELYLEMGRLIKQRRLSLKRLVALFIYVSRAHYEAKMILKYFRENGLYDSNEKGIIYSYRFEYQPYVGLLIKKHLPKFKIVARGHRYDLYEEMNSVAYIPMRELLMEKLEKIITISNDGKEYLAQKYPKFKDKIIISKLGTIDYGVKSVPYPKGEINLVSCSYIVPIKRVNLIVKSLQHIRDIKVNWTHYGDGECFEEIKSQSLLLSSNIHCEFRGYVSNREVLEEYSNRPYHLFLNVSASEGIPVSIMEAMSFGMPSVATDVGGTKEIITDGINGVLLDVDFSPKELATIIESFSQIDKETYQIFRKNARELWETKFDADKNFRDFVTDLIFDD